MDQIIGMAGVNDKCIRRYAQSVKRNAQFLLNPAKTVQYTAGIVLPNAEITTASGKTYQGLS